MNNKDKIKFVKIMTGLAEMYEFNLSDVQMGMWFNLLKIYRINEISEAVSDYMRNPDTGRYKPKPADIIKMIDGSTSDQAAIAWTKLDKAVRMVGDYQTVVFDDPLIHRVLTDMGGWVGFGDKDTKEWTFIAKDFCQRYRFYVSKSILPECPNKLTGSHESYNLRNGFDVDPPVLIGDSEKAEKVLCGGKANPFQITTSHPG